MAITLLSTPMMSVATRSGMARTMDMTSTRHKSNSMPKERMMSKDEMASMMYKIHGR